MEWVSGDQKFNRIKQEGPGSTRSSVPAMHDSLDHLADRLKTFENFQTHQRIREAIGRKRMENLANFVSYSSIWNIVLILIVGLGEVYFVDFKSFFVSFNIGRAVFYFGLGEPHPKIFSKVSFLRVTNYALKLKITFLKYENFLEP
jgi:hypothetical protein